MQHPRPMVVEDATRDPRFEHNPLAVGRVDVRTLVDEAVREARLQADRDGSAIQVRCPADLGGWSMDPELVRRILDNLIDNALQHAGREVRIAVEVEVLRDEVLRVCVDDDGSPGSSE